MASLDNFPRSEAAQRMLSYVTQNWYDKSYVGKWVYEVMGREVDNAVEISEELALQFDIYSVTWGMKYWEMMYGLTVKPSLDIEERRKLVLAKMSPHEAGTPYWMEKELSEASGYTVNVYDKTDPGSYSFKNPNIFMVVLSDDSEMDFDHTRAVINNMKQSHTLYDLSYLPIVMDLIAKEKIVPRLTMRMPLKWWEGYLLNGEQILDGAQMLSQLYPQIFNEMAYRILVPENEDISIASTELLFPVEHSEEITASGKYRLPFIWWTFVTLSGEQMLDGAIALAEYDASEFRQLTLRQPVEAEEDIGVYLRYSEDDGALDGLNTLGGTIFLNSRREEL